MPVSMIGPKFYCWDKDGKPLAGGLVYTYQARTNIPKPTYMSEDGLVANSNPVELNSAGYADIYLDGAYKIVVKDKSGKEIWTEDPVTAQGQTTSEWLPAQSLTFVDADTFTVAGNQAEFFTAGRGLRLKGDNYLYAQVVDATYSGGNTHVNVVGDTLTADLATVSLSVITNDSRYGRYGDVTYYANLAALLVEKNLKVGEYVGIVDRETVGDRGGNVYRVVSAGTGVHDNGEYINHANSGVQLLATFPNGRNVKQYGAKGDGATNDLPAFQAAMQGDTSLYVPPGEYYIDGDGSSGALVSWYAEGNGVQFYGDGTASKIVCSPSVVHFASFTGMHIHHLEFDGGFDPNTATALLVPLLVTNQDTKVSNVKIRNTYGSNIFGKFGPIDWIDNDLGNYGDHALYMSYDADTAGATGAINIRGNLITQTYGYENGGSGAREAIKIRNHTKDVTVTENIMYGVAEGVMIDNDDQDIPENVIVNHNIIYMEPGPGSSSYAGIVFHGQNLANDYAAEAQVAWNVIVGASDGAGTGIVVQPAVRSDIAFNRISGVAVGISSQAANAAGGEECTIAYNRIWASNFGIYQAGSGAEIVRNKIYGFASAGIRDKFGNVIEDNTLDSSESGAIGIALLVEADVSQPRRSVCRNKIHNVNHGIQLSSLANNIPLDLIGNRFFDCQSNSIWNVNSSDTLAVSRYYDNVVVSGVAITDGNYQGIPLDNFAGLPTASAEWRGKMVLRTTGDVDTVYVCRQTAVDTYAWSAVTVT